MNKSTGVGHAKNLNTAVHTGPNAGCSIIAYVGSIYEMRYDCWFVNSAGNH
ncbi:hypothetical protein OOK36_17665 [Streptomyces sp. NBC_00365]|uniref:hypothetical protein n=1 Tax=Streptomyces sp. NBC_00365 TaxID=2975726 RepID=UPI002251455C|nr:hypothetical protein [Streptomyces sp. NBC_00365]MCX5090690.1 hypothetical protein [Streptomyces sp. NBC_00365]